MIIIRNYKCRLYPTSLQEKCLKKYIAGCRKYYNELLADRKKYYVSTGKSKSSNEQRKELTPIIQEKYPWLKEIPSIALVCEVIKLEEAYKASFRRIKKGQPAGFPKFRWWKSPGQSFELSGSYYENKSVNQKKNATFTINNFGIHLPVPRNTTDIGYIKMKGYDELYKKPNISPKEVVVSFRKNKWYATICCRVEISDPQQNTTTNIGIDYGIKQDYTTSNGDVLTVYHKNGYEEKKLKRLQRQLARKEKGSENRKKLIQKMAAVQEKINNKKKDSLHKSTTHLAENYNKICVEDLNITNMTKSAKGTINKPGKNVKQKSGRNRELQDRNFGEFSQMLDYKTKEHGGELIKVNPAYTSQICSSCGYCHPDNRKTQENFTCLSCGMQYNADMNAALNILRLGTDGQSGIVSGIVGSVCSSNDENQNESTTRYEKSSTRSD